MSALTEKQKQALISGRRRGIEAMHSASANEKRRKTLADGPRNRGPHKLKYPRTTAQIEALKTARLKGLKAMHSTESRAKAKASLIEKDHYKKLYARRREQVLAQINAPEAKRKSAETNRRPDVIARRVEAWRNSKKWSGKEALRFEQLSKRLAKTWIVKSPKNEIFEFTNLCAFVKANPFLFDADAVIWRKGTKQDYCLAYVGLSTLRPTRKRPKNSWRGWTYISITERLEHADILNLDCDAAAKEVAA